MGLETALNATSGMNGAGELDVEMLLARIRERVQARRSPGEAGSRPQAEETSGDTGTANDANGDPVQAEFDQSVAGAVVTLAQHIRSGQRSMELVQEWVRTETERTAQREWETRAQLEAVVRAMTLMNERQDRLEALVHRMEEKPASGRPAQRRGDLLQAARELRGGIDLLITRLERLERKRPLVSSRSSGQMSTPEEV